jgi:LysM repeat protein
LTWATHAFAIDAEPSSPPPFVDHTVVQGDTLYALAMRYGSSVELMVRANGIADVRRLRIGATLQAPLVQSTLQTVAPARPLVAKSSDLLEIEQLLERSETQLRDARFEAALDSAEAARKILDRSAVSSLRSSRVRLEIISATVYIAWGKRDAALSSLTRALQADPDLALDPALISPKVLSVFRAARMQLPTSR